MARYLKQYVVLLYVLPMLEIHCNYAGGVVHLLELSCIHNDYQRPVFSPIADSEQISQFIQNFQTKLQQFWLFYMRDICIWVFVLCSSLRWSGFGLDWKKSNVLPCIKGLAFLSLKSDGIFLGCLLICQPLSIKIWSHHTHRFHSNACVMLSRNETYRYPVDFSTAGRETVFYYI